MRAILVLAAAIALLLSGCIGVPQDKYDALKLSCDQQQKDAAGALAAEKAKSAQLNGKLSDCTVAKQGAESLLSTRSAECEALKNDSTVLKAAREKTALIATYRTATQYYNDAYGPGNIPNTYKYNRMDSLLNGLPDKTLYYLWMDVKGCQGIVACDAAKDKFTSTINSSITALSLQIADMVR